jgi:hypothetical protein
MSSDQKTGLQALVGKYVIATFPHPLAGIVETAVDDAHYLVRFESDGDMPETLQVVAISDMARAGGTAESDPPPWLFFDGIEERAKFLAWMNETPPDGRPRVVPLRPNPKSPKPAS